MGLGLLGITELDSSYKRCQVPFFRKFSALNLKIYPINTEPCLLLWFVVLWNNNEVFKVLKANDSFCSVVRRGKSCAYDARN